MYYGRGMRRAYGRGMGFGFRGSSPPWPYVGIGRGGLPRCWAFGGYGGPVAGYAPPATPFYPGPGAYGMGPLGAPYSTQEEIGFLKGQAEMLRQEVNAIDARIKELEKEKPPGGEE
jgi:hypothetical protein